MNQQSNVPGWSPRAALPISPHTAIIVGGAVLGYLVIGNKPLGLVLGALLGYAVDRKAHYNALGALPTFGYG